LFAFGGAGPVHAYHLAAKLGVPEVIVPLRAGVLSALGLVTAPVAYDTVRTHRVPLVELDAHAIDAVFREMADDVTRTLRTADRARAASGVTVCERVTEARAPGVLGARAPADPVRRLRSRRARPRHDHARAGHRRGGVGDDRHGRRRRAESGCLGLARDHGRKG